MLKKLALAVAAAFISLASPALAQNPQTVKLCVPTSTTACPVVTASAPLPVTGTFSATLAGFTPNGSYTTLTATAASSASTNLPSGTVVAFQNLSTVDVSCVLTAGASTATTNKLIVRGGATVYYTVGSNTTTACINQTGSASNVVGLAGGAGLGTAFGGGGGGGGGTVDQGNAGSNAQAWWAQIGDTARGPAKVQAGNSAATTDVALTVVDPNVLAAVNAGTTKWATGTLGPMANYGTSPGPVLVPGMNAYITGSAVGATAGTTSTGALGQMVNSASTTSPSGQSTGNQSYLNSTTNGQIRVTPSYGTTDAVGDPCQTVAKINFTGTQTTGTQIIAGTSSKKTYICSFSIRAAAAEIWNVIAGTGSVCATGSSAVAGSTTAANGFSEAANGGQTLGNGLGTVMAATAANADNICITQNGSSRLTYQLTYVQQ